MKLALIALLAAGCATAAAWPGRSAAVRAEFVKTNPCPVTGKSRGSCRGYQVDHIKPLKCGGEDSPGNLQWLTVEEHKAKTKAEAGRCRNGNS